MSNVRDRVNKRLQKINGLESPEEVAQFLNKQGITGVPCRSDRCPVANYLSKSLVGTNWIVDVNDGAHIFHTVTEDVEDLDLSEEARQFINGFDAGHFAFLKEEI